jgi:hypothetical protein
MIARPYMGYLGLVLSGSFIGQPLGVFNSPYRMANR